MSAGGIVAAPLPPGTRLGKRHPGTLMVLCQCCRFHPEVMASVERGRVIIQDRRPRQRHFVVLGPELVDRLDENQKIWCVCCDPEIEYRRQLAECRDGLLLIRAMRHGDPHFVALTAARLQVLLAASGQSA